MSRSEFLPFEPFDDLGGHVCQLELEFAPNGKRPRAIYIVFDGRRIAFRGGRAWVPLVAGYEVLDDTPDTIAVVFDGERLCRVWPFSIP